MLICPLFPATMAQLDAAYTVHGYYQAADKDAFIAGIADRLTAARDRRPRGHERGIDEPAAEIEGIACFGVGVDGIDVAAARKLGISVTNTPDVLTECVADNAWALILGTMRRTVFNDKFVRAGNWLKGNAPLAQKVAGNHRHRRAWTHRQSHRPARRGLRHEDRLSQPPSPGRGSLRLLR